MAISLCPIVIGCVVYHIEIQTREFRNQHRWSNRINTQLQKRVDTYYKVAPENPLRRKNRKRGFINYNSKFPNFVTLKETS